jgi:hypothetical protein
MLLCVVLIFQTLNTFNTVVSPIYYDMFPAALHDVASSPCGAATPAGHRPCPTAQPPLHEVALSVLRAVALMRRQSCAPPPLRTTAPVPCMLLPLRIATLLALRAVDTACCRPYALCANTLWENMGRSVS